MEKGLEKAPMLMYRKRPRQEFDPSVVDLGSPELTKLWSIEPDILKFCKEPKRWVINSFRCGTLTFQEIRAFC